MSACGSNGVCIDGLNTFECTCNDGFDGIPCEPIVMNGKVLYDNQIYEFVFLYSND